MKVTRFKEGRTQPAGAIIPQVVTSERLDVFYWAQDGAPQWAVLEGGGMQMVEDQLGCLLVHLRKGFQGQQIARSEIKLRDLGCGRQGRDAKMLTSSYIHTNIYEALACFSSFKSQF
eukprot:1159757-Pelagomonas_calceolata.AAC.3